MPSFEVTVQCNKCNGFDIHCTDDRVEVGDGWPDQCKNCGTDTHNEITNVEASDD